MVKSKKTTQPSKASAIKRSNKRYSKLLKRGKLRPSVRRHNKGAGSYFRVAEKPESKARKSVVDYGSEEEVDVSDMVDDETKLPTFLGSNDIENEPKPYEEVRRQFKNVAASQYLKPLLPIKKKQVVIPRFHETQDGDEEVDEDQTNAAESENLEVDETEKENEDAKNETIFQLKLKISKLAESILEDPVKNLKCLHDLITMMENSRIVTCPIKQKLLMVSLLEVFRDILPDYKIRARTDEERKVKLSKEVRETVVYEENLLSCYKTYLQILENISTKTLLKKSKRKNSNSQVQPACQSVGVIAVKCLCELVVAHPSTNFSPNIIATLVPFCISRNKDVVELCCRTFELLFRQDTLGSVSLDAVKHIVRLLKKRAYKLPSQVLHTFLYLRLKHITATTAEKTREEKIAEREKRNRLSRREFKRAKEMRGLQQELLETQAEESLQKRIAHQTDIIKHVFNAYFQVLKREPKSEILSEVLEGLAKFAHLINFTFFEDLITVLHKLVESNVLTCRQCMHCTEVVFIILSGQGQALNIDPYRFYSHVYKNLLNLHVGLPEEDVLVALVCLDHMIVKRRKQVSRNRLLAFTKRLSTVALQLTHGGSIAVLALIRNIMTIHQQLDLLVDTDVSLGSGCFMPELEDPEYCNAESTTLWELDLLKSHYHSLVQQLSASIACGDAQKDEKRSTPLFTSPPEELLENHSMGTLDYDFPSDLSDSFHKKKTVKNVKFWRPVNKKFYEHAEEVLQTISITDFCNE